MSGVSPHTWACRLSPWGQMELEVRGDGPWASSRRAVVCPPARDDPPAPAPSTQTPLPADTATAHPAHNESPHNCILLPWGLKNNDFDHLLSKS